MRVGNQVGKAGMYHLTPLWQQTSLVTSLGPQACFPGWGYGSRRVEGWATMVRIPTSFRVGKRLCQPSSEMSHSSRKHASGLGQPAGISGFQEKPGLGHTQA